MSIYVDYVPFRPRKSPLTKMKKLYDIKVSDTSWYSGEWGSPISSVFRGVKKDIEKVAEILGEAEIEKINDIVYETWSFSGSLTDNNRILDAIQEVPGCKAAVYFCGKWDHRTVGSEPGYPFFTVEEVPNSMGALMWGKSFHAKEDEGAWQRNVNPKKVFKNWDSLDYVVEIDGKKMKMTDIVDEGDIEVQFIEGGAKLIKVKTKEKIVHIPHTIREQSIIKVQKGIFKKVEEIRAPYISINKWPDKDSRPLVALGYVNGLKDGIEFNEEVVKGNEKYLKKQNEQ